MRERFNRAIFFSGHKRETQERRNSIYRRRQIYRDLLIKAERQGDVSAETRRDRSLPESSLSAETRRFLEEGVKQSQGCPLWLFSLFYFLYFRRLTSIKRQMKRRNTLAVIVEHLGCLSTLTEVDAPLRNGKSGVNELALNILISLKLKIFRCIDTLTSSKPRDHLGLRCDRRQRSAPGGDRDGEKQQKNADLNAIKNKNKILFHRSNDQCLFSQRQTNYYLQIRPALGRQSCSAVRPHCLFLVGV